MVQFSKSYVQIPSLHNAGCMEVSISLNHYLPLQIWKNTIVYACPMQPVSTFHRI